MLSHIVSDLHESYVNEILKPQLGSGDQKPGGGDRPGEDSSEKKVRQAVYDIRYRARRENVPVESAFNQYMAHSSLSSSEKAIVKEKLGLSRPSGGGDTQKEETEIDEASMPEFSSRNKSGKSSGSKGKYKVRVTDKLSGKSYVRYATRAKITALRNNPNISSVEMTSYGEPYEGERTKGSSTAKATAGKGLDPVGKEDGDVNNDGKKDKTDKYLMNRRDKIGQAIAKDDKKQLNNSFEVEVPDKDIKKLAKKASKRIDTNVSGHVDKKDKSMGDYGEFVPSPDGKKKVITKIGEGAVGDRAKKVVDSQRRGYHGDSDEVEDLLKQTQNAVVKAKRSARIPKYGKVTPSMPTESFSDWRTELKEVIVTKDGEKKIKEKKVNNKVVINPQLKTESKVIESVELSEEYVFETINCAVDYFVSEGINEEGLEIIIDELGLDEFVGFVFEYGEEVLTEARAARKARKGAKSYAEIKAEIDAREKAKVAKKPAPKPVAKAAEVAKKKQPEKKPVRDAIARGVFRAVDAYKKGMERHNAAMATAKKAGEVGGKVAKEFGKGFASGVKTAADTAKKTKKAVVGEAVYGGKKEEPKDTRMIVTKADKKGNTKAYQNYKAGDKRYKSVGLDEKTEKVTPETGNSSAKEEQQRKQQLAKQQQMLQKKIMLQKQQLQLQKQGKLPMGHTMEQTDSVFDKVRRELMGKHGAASIVGTPENKAAAEKRKKEAEARKAKVKPKTDTRTDAEKMADATGPRPGSRYRGD